MIDLNQYKKGSITGNSMSKLFDIILMIVFSPIALILFIWLLLKEEKLDEQ